MIELNGIYEIYPKWRTDQLTGSVLCWFSCGKASAVATKLAIDWYAGKKPIRVLYTDPGAEHKDNHRFLRDCEKWFGMEVEVLKSSQWADVDDVIERGRFLRGPQGAKCTAVLKKRLRQEVENTAEDIQVFGFDARPRERKRADRFRQMNPEVVLQTPLIETGLTHESCGKIMEIAGIKTSIMYELGFPNANCIGCVKAEGAAYWNLVRKHFPEVFKRRAEQERQLNYALVRVKKKPVFLDELPEDEQSNDQDGSSDCGLLCGYDKES